MTQLPVVFHPDVEEDLAEIYAHYREFDAVLPERFEARLDEQVERLGMFPESGAILVDAYRRVLVKRVSLHGGLSGRTRTGRCARRREHFGGPVWNQVGGHREG